MFYVLRMARPQFFVVFRQLKHRQQVAVLLWMFYLALVKVVQSPGFKETVSRYGLTVSNARLLITSHNNGLIRNGSRFFLSQCVRSICITP